MEAQDSRARLFPLFADLLDYPAPGMSGAAHECAQLAASINPEAGRSLEAFCDWLAGRSEGELEELYTGTFELNAAVHPYVGYHLFGETYQRSVFLLSLGEHYRSAGFQPGAELADHLVVMLRFLACCPDPLMANELIEEGLAPALAKMVRQEPAEPEDGEAAVATDSSEGYRHLLRALQLVLEQMQGFKIEATA